MMKHLFILPILLFLTSCAMTQQDWQRASQISGGSAQLYTSMEAQNMQRDMLNYQIQQQTLAAQRSGAPAVPDCDLNCRNQKHQLETQLLYLEMQNATLKAQGY